MNHHPASRRCVRRVAAHAVAAALSVAAAWVSGTAPAQAQSLSQMAAANLAFDQQQGAMLARLQQPLPAAANEPSETTNAPRSLDALPRPLQPYFGKSWKALRWRWMAPGVHMIRAPRSSGDTLILLRIAPGKSMPVHSHGGSELTQILKGAYDDELGHFGPGDMADLDSDIEHQPVTSPGVPCICVAALDGPLQFRGWLARKLQPMVGL